jgi:hypothetical protein
MSSSSGAGATFTLDEKSNSKLEIPKLADDGKNYWIWSEKIQLVLEYQGLAKYLDVKATPPAEVTYADADKPTASEKAQVKEREDWIQGMKKTRITLLLAVGDETFKLVSRRETAKEVWAGIAIRFQGIGAQSAAFLMTKLWRTQMDGDKELLPQITELRGYADSLTSLGFPLPDVLIAIAIIISLPADYQTLQTILTSTRLKPDTDSVIASILAEESLRRETGDVLLKARTSKAGKSSVVAKKGGNECSNCGKTGHSIANCWAEGGGKEGKGPKRKGKKEKAKVAEEEKTKDSSQTEPAKANLAFAPESDEREESIGVQQLWIADAESIDENDARTRDEKAMVVREDGSTTATWIVDSGASAHMTSHRSWFTTYSTLTEPRRIYLGDKSVIEGVGVGTIPISINVNNKTTKVLLTQVLHVPNVSSNLISIPTLARNGIDTICDASGASFVKHQTGELQALARISGGLYTLRTTIQTVERVCISYVVESKDGQKGANDTYVFSARHSRSSKATLETWHRRLAHVQPDTVLRMVKEGMVDGMEITSTTRPALNSGHCPPCLQGKQTRNEIPKETQTRAKEVLGRIFSDVCEPGIRSYKGHYYFMTVTDDASRWTEVAFLSKKSDVRLALEQVIAKMELETGKRVKKLRTDGGGEYVANEVELYLRNRGIQHERTNPYTPQEDGVSERKNRTLNDKARSSIYETAQHNILHRQNPLPKPLWEQAIRHAVYVENRTPTNALPKSITPYEAYYGQKPNLSMLRIFGCKAWAHVPARLRKDKFDSHSRECIHIGYADGMRAYLLYDPKTKQVFESRDVKFDEGAGEEPERILVELDDDVVAAGESRGISQKDGGDEMVGEPDTDDGVGNEVEGGDGGEAGGVFIESASGVGDSGGDNGQEATEDDVQTSGVPSMTNLPSPSAPNPSNISTRRPTRAKRAPVPDDDARYFITSRNKSGKAHGLAAVGEEHVFIARDREYDEKMNSPEAPLWLEAMNEEIATQHEMGTWEEVIPPRDAHVIGCRWVYAEKRDSEGNIVRYKARLVAKGYAEREGIDFNETYAPTPKKSSILTLIALAARFDWEAFQVDVKSAYLHATLDEEIFMSAPAGYPLKNPNAVLRLLRPLYGLRQAADCFYQFLSGELQKAGMKQSADPCVFVAADRIIATHVDDMACFSINAAVRKRTISDLASRFKIHDLGDLHHYVGMKISRNRDLRTFTISQERYIIDILTRFDLINARPFSMPLQPGLKLSKRSEPSDYKTLRTYQAMLGCLMYAVTGTRPDLSFAACYLSQFASAPGPEHLNALKYTFHYLAGTTDFALHYDGKRPLEFVGYVDSDWASDPNGRRSVSGYAFTLGGNLISWSAKKQPTVALSSTEGEYMAATHAACETIFVRSFISSLNFDFDGPTTLFMDNQSAMAIAFSTVAAHNSRTKHIDVRHHWIREKVAEDVISLEYIHTSQQPADLFTKALPTSKVIQFRNDLGLKSIGSR